MIKKIYCAVHLGFERLNKIGGPSQLMHPDSFYRYHEVKHQQELLLRQAEQDPEAAIIYIPVFATNPDTSFLEQYDRALVDLAMGQISELESRMQERFLLVIDTDTDNPFINLLKPLRGLVFNLYNKAVSHTSTQRGLLEQIHFEFDPKQVKFIYFGEMTSGCVTKYGERIADLLGIPPKNLEIRTEASVDYNEILYEDVVSDEIELK